ncbi:ComEA family DNA-binding protein [Hydrocarboniclastica marina]|uniref:ComEA family DNA-binding protein n=1 Tax=Hydrocarboniclastica marina TaxID=2259620 RepID=A0A4P7XIC2_9ALTE|nr:ComEA family DNA-binding protein [Hydrocarboniclastica marina]
MNRNIIASLVLLVSLMVSGLALAEEPATWSVNLNTATVEVLAESLEGIGASKAQAIVDYREANGSFKAVDDLANVKGIGASTIEKNRKTIVLE